MNYFESERQNLKRDDVYDNERMIWEMDMELSLEAWLSESDSTSLYHC